MRENETELEMVRRHIEVGTKQLAKQRALIMHLRSEGIATEKAEALMVTFEAIQREHEDHLTRITAKPI